MDGHVFSEGRGERIYISINKNHLSCRVRIIGYIWVTLNPVKSETLSLDMILKNSSIMARVWFALLSFFLSIFQLWGHAWYKGVHFRVHEVHGGGSKTNFHI